MYTLLYGAYKQATRKEEYSVLLLGLDNAGKTTLLESLKSVYAGIVPRPPHQIVPTVGLNIGRINVDGIKLSIWDLGGQLELHGIWEKYYDECHGIVFVIDSTDVDRLETSIRAFMNVVAHSAVRTVPILVLANKQDSKQAVGVERILEKFIADTSGLEEHDCRVQPLVALKGDGAREAMSWLVRGMTVNAPNRPPKLSE
eukprot:Unigene6976_Nuclearia_a/m.21372 Unigene6976_Nuclearia_a/g.21372  ORF Unigene6976_Nuclearia_a/g.21372 Unigene6976_Nuclearia_a/m.21372 type:complete len:200 (-) Unigene6976_Nuclearia_a:68-667(-)